MGNKKDAATAHKQEWELAETELTDQECEDRTLVLGKEPPSRKVQLMAAGVKEIRCICCVRIRPIAVAEEFGEGWICEDCLSDAPEEPRYGGQRGR